MSAVEVVGYIAVVLNIGVYLMRTMIPLRMLAIVSNSLFIAFSALASIYPTLLLNCILLPLNIYRLTEMILLVRRARLAATGHDFDISFIHPYTKRRDVAAGETIFSKGDAADAMYIIKSGRFVLPEIGVELPAGALVGELGLLAPSNARTQSLVCQEGGTLLVLSYDQFKRLFFQNPRFGFYFLQLTTSRLFENIEMMEKGPRLMDALAPQTG